MPNKYRNQSGPEGERVAATLLGKVRSVDLKGADLISTGARPNLFEVKSTFSRPGKVEKIILKTRNGRWTNELADHLIIVTRTHLFFADADHVRQHVEEHYDSFQKLAGASRKRRKNASVLTRINVPIQHLVEHRVAKGIPRADELRILKELRKRLKQPPVAFIRPVRETKPKQALPKPPEYHLKQPLYK